LNERSETAGLQREIPRIGVRRACRRRCLGNGSKTTSITIVVRDSSGWRAASGGWQTGHGSPTPQPQASVRSLNPRHGLSRWFSHTHPLLSQTLHRRMDFNGQSVKA
jgi:hypothetical protein